MKTVVIIPARFASTRFPGKPLARIGEKTMIQRVYEQAKKAKGIHDVVVATDDARIADEVKRFHGNCVMTSASHVSGTDRCAEVLNTLGDDVDAVINVQGDEPFIHPEQIEQVLSILYKPNVQIASLARKISTQNDASDSSKVKVTFTNEYRALYFSRSTIPFAKNTAEYFIHVGIYGFKTKILNQITLLKPSSLELSESLEQLRWLQNGYTIHLGITPHETVGIDSPEDLDRVSGLF